MNQSIPREHGYQSRIRTSILRLFYWGVAWVASCALMSFGRRFLWSQSPGLTLLSAGLNVCVGVALLLAHKRYIAELDELQRKVYLNALAITVGIALIAGVPWSVLDRYRMISFHADAAGLIALMSLTFVVSVVYGMWRYR